jgi:integrase
MSLAMGTKPREKAGERYRGVYFRELDAPHNGKPDRAWEIIYRGVHGKTVTEKVGRSSQGMTARKAYEVLNLRKATVANGEEPQRKTGSPTLDDCWELYRTWATQQGKHIGPEENRYQRHLQPPFGGRRLIHIDPSDVATFKAEKLKADKPLSPQSVKHILALARRIVAHALEVKKRYRDMNPFEFNEKRGTSLGKLNNERVRFFTTEEAHALLEELSKRSQQLHDMAFLSLHTGLRATEIFGLKGADVHPDTSIIHVTSKGGNRELVHVDDPDGSLFKMLASYVNEPDSLLFPARSGKRIVTISDTFPRACAALGLNTDFTPDENKATFHTLRHTFASWLAQDGSVTLYQLQALMRHRRIEMTQRYAHLVPEEISAKQSVIRNRLSSCSSPSS